MSDIGRPDQEWAWDDPRGMPEESMAEYEMEQARSAALDASPEHEPRDQDHKHIQGARPMDGTMQARDGETEAPLTRAVPELTLRTSPESDKIAVALAKAQGAMENPRRDREVTVTPRDSGKRSYKFKYATLGAINDVIRGPLAENGICLVQSVVRTRPVSIVTRLMCGAQWIESILSIGASPSSPQDLGSVISYLRRYSIVTLLNIASDDDDDANIAEGNHVQDARQKAPPNDAREQEAARERESLIEQRRGIFQRMHLEVGRLRKEGDVQALRYGWMVMQPNLKMVREASASGADKLEKEYAEALAALTPRGTETAKAENTQEQERQREELPA